MNQSKNILLVPLVQKGHGTGHVRRMLSLADGMDGNTRILAENPEIREQVLKIFPGKRLPEFVSDEDAAAIEWDLVVFDRLATDPETALKYSPTGRIAGLDEGGPFRGSFAFLVDILPFPDAGMHANISDPGFLDLPRANRIPPEKIRTVLLSFGGEDPACLTGPCTEAVLDSGRFSPQDVTVVTGPLSVIPDLPPGVKVLEAPADLKEMLHEFDLVLTSFGITAFEAVSAGVPVILCNPSAYHTKLSEYSGFPHIGHECPDTGKLKYFLSNPGVLLDFIRSAKIIRREPLHALFSGMDFSGGTVCPSCGNAVNESVRREEYRTFFRCRSCRLLFQKNYSSECFTYSREYFFEEYRAQYGRTYLDDFSSIKAAGTVRSQEILQLLDNRSGASGVRTILDIGCAYGPFLSAARDAGFLPFGLDVSEDAVKYVGNTLGIEARTASFPDWSPRADFGIDRFSSVTMWYVIEHFRELPPVLHAVHELLVPGGVFAFSTPNASGISASRNMQGFLSRSPRDHFTLWEPGKTAELLRGYGFRLKKIRITGHHPERFPVFGKYVAGAGFRSKLLSWILLRISVVFGLGDTFEVYAVSVRP